MKVTDELIEQVAQRQLTNEIATRLEAARARARSGVSASMNSDFDGMAYLELEQRGQFPEHAAERRVRIRSVLEALAPILDEQG